ncbi:MAG TPA: TldD/PmbA family protein [Clostridiaceae bacterium]
MEINEFKNKLFIKAKEFGYSEFEIYCLIEDASSIEIFENKVDKYSLNKRIGISFRGNVKGKMGYSYTEAIDEMSIDMLLSKAFENAEIVDDHIEPIYAGKGTYKKLNNYSESLVKITDERKIEFGKALEERAKKISSKIIRSEVMISSTENKKYIYNSKGLGLSHKKNSLLITVEVVASDRDKMYCYYSYKYCKSLKEEDIDFIAKEAVEGALACINGDSVASGKYAVILKNEAAIDMLETFSGIFSSDNVQKGLSLLKSTLGKEIGSKVLTIIDNPLLAEGLMSSPFDSEGVPTYSKEVVKAGELKTLLYNLKTALKDGVNSTGNGFRTNYTSPIEVAPSNFYIEPGRLSYLELIQELKEGLVINELQGLHSGANPISGDFSLAAKGFLVKKGNIVGAVEQITISGNFYRLLKDIKAVGADMKFGMASGKGSFGSPSILIKEVSISGK